MAQVIKVESPYSGEVVAEVPLLDLAVSVRLLEASAAAQREWAKVALAERIKVVERFNEALLAAKEKVAKDITQQMGKPLGQARGFHHAIRGHAGWPDMQVAQMQQNHGCSPEQADRGCRGNRSVRPASISPARSARSRRRRRR